MPDDRSFEVKGMTCTGCEQRITGALAGLVGVESAWADLHTGEVRVTADTSASEKEMREAIEELGYRVVA